MKRARKLSLSRETLWQLDTQGVSTSADDVNESCAKSCFDMSCGCTVSALLRG
jgi:hypothetical protein